MQFAIIALTALVGARYLPTHYGLYYMGVIELSSIPLTLYDMCDRLSELAAKPAGAADAAPSVPPAKLAALRALRDTSRTVAAVCFVLVRAFDFTRVTLTRFVPDALSVLALPTTAAGFVWPIRFMLASSVGFVGLQLYWFSLFVRVSLAEGQRQKRRASRKQRKGGAAGAAGAEGSMSVAQACRFMEANAAVPFDEKKAFLLAKGVSPFVIAQAACTATDAQLVL